MAGSFDSIREIIKQYIDTIRAHGISVDKTYLFGSYAHGRAVEGSDIDLAIISKDFKGDRFVDRRLIVPMRRNIDLRLEPIPYRPEDFNMNDPLAIEILENGIELDLMN